MIGAIWYRCPVCGCKLARMEPDAIARRIYIWCRHCKKEYEVTARPPKRTAGARAEEP